MQPKSLDSAYERESLIGGHRFKPVFPENAAYGQPPPIPNDLPEVWNIVMKDMEKRNQFGKNKYGVALQPNNGRDALKDAYEEALDLCVYLRQAVWERDKK